MDSLEAGLVTNKEIQMSAKSIMYKVITPRMQRERIAPTKTHHSLVGNAKEQICLTLMRKVGLQVMIL